MHSCTHMSHTLLSPSLSVCRILLYHVVTYLISSPFILFYPVAGWEDAPLAVEGRNEALFAGQLLKAHGVQVQTVLTQ